MAPRDSIRPLVLFGNQLGVSGRPRWPATRLNAKTLCGGEIRDANVPPNAEMKPSLKCATLSILFSYPMSIAFALLFRFPIPMGGYIGPASKHEIDYSLLPEALKMVSIAWIVYGIFGGFFALAGASVAACKLTFRKSTEPKPSQVHYLAVRAISVAFLGCGVLAILDFIIGPW